MRQFHPRRSWLWAQWHGTIVKSVLRNEVRLIVAWSLVLMVAVACSYTAAPSGGRALLRMSEAARSAAPAPGGGGAAGVAASLHSMLSFKGFLVAGPRAPAATAAEQAVAATLAALKPIERFWAIAQTLVAFVLSFFLQQTYTVWRTVYSISRRVQGRLSDVGLLLAVNAERDAAGNVTPRAQEVLDTAGRYCRLFNVLFFASVTRQYAPFATPKGLRALQAAGVIRQDELDVLIETSSWHQTVAAWLGTLTARAVGDGRIGGGGALYFQLSGVLALLRAQYAQMADELSGRMPLAYTHFVQVLVDSLCLAAPLALVGQLGLVGAVVATAFVTLFYAGILDLAKMFLDPFDNEDYGGRSGIRIEAHTLVQEVNSLTFRWAKCAQKLPRGVLEALPTLETPPEPLSDDSRLAGDEPRRSDDAVEGYGATSAAYVAYGSLPLDEDSDDTGGAGAPLCTSGDVIIPFADAADDEAQPPRTFNVEAVV
ncbi:Bestrophin, RFP-TM, chloride channel-domain-containing protein [Pelagophyceae sp. CCMP2097]|nr:Bestrophin, RFP-TM, chloride channel-domain-containing protein [Pelagophyceae sp. CCMP2097]